MSRLNFNGVGFSIQPKRPRHFHERVGHYSNEGSRKFSSLPGEEQKGINDSTRYVWVGCGWNEWIYGWIPANPKEDMVLWVL